MTFPHEIATALPPEDRAPDLVDRLNRQFAYVRERSNFYRAKLGVVLGPFDGLDDFAKKVPVTTKQELRADQSAFPPFGSNLCISKNEIARIQGTSGTTGRSTLLCFSPDDWENASSATARICANAGLTSSDRLAITMPLHLFVGGWGLVGAAETLGATVLTVGGLHPEKQLEIMLETDATALVSTPSYALHLVRLAEGLGLDLAASPLRLAFLGGEPGLGVPEFRNRIETGLGVRAIDFGNTAEVHPCSNMGCGQSDGMHIYDDIVYTEIVDPDDPTRLVPEGEEGILVYTPLDRQAMPLLRFWSGDLGIATSAPCACGQPYRRIVGGLRGRLDDLIIHRGVKFLPVDVERLISETLGTPSPFAMVQQGAESSYTLFVEWQQDVPEVAAQLAEALRRDLTCTIPVRLVDPGRLPKAGLKAKRVWRAEDGFALGETH